VAVAQNHRVDGPEPGDIRQMSGRRAFAEIEQEPLPGYFEKETGWGFGADPGNEP
jgi:hypothetical protein